MNIYLVLYGPRDWSTSDETANNYKCHLQAPNDKVCANYKIEEGLIGLAHAAGAKIFPSIGGWTLSDNFPTVAASATTRSNFVKQCVELIKMYDFDGIDIDWEYPGYADHSGTPQDTANYNLLLQEIKKELALHGAITGKYYELTAALPCGPSIIDNIDIGTVKDLLDQFNLMTYDFFGAWSSVVGVNAPMYYQTFPDYEQFGEFNVNSCVINWMNGGVTKDKINIGLPFYGRSFANAKGLNEEYSGADTINWADDEGTPQFFNIEKRLYEMTSVRDEITKTQYAYFESGGVVSYDDQRAICDKVEYAIDNELNGFIIWEITGDVRDDLTTPLLDEVNLKLKDPNGHNCAGQGQFNMGEDDDSYNTNKSRKVVKWIIIVCCVVFVLLIGSAILFVYRRKQMRGKATFEGAVKYSDKTVQKVVLANMGAPLSPKDNTTNVKC